MNKIIRNIVIYFLIGVGIGNLIAPVSFMLSDVGQLTVSTYVSISVISGLIGLASLALFGLNDFPLKISLPIHYFLVLGLVLFLNFYNAFFSINNLDYLVRFWFQFSIIYVLVWSLVIYTDHQKVSKINEKLRERKNSLDKD